MRRVTCRSKVFKEHNARSKLRHGDQGATDHGDHSCRAVPALAGIVPRLGLPIRIDAPHEDNGPAAATPDVPIETQLQLAAVQLASIRFHYPSQSLWKRAKTRFRNEFLPASPKGKLRFLRSAAKSVIARIVPKNAGAVRRRAADKPPKTSELSVAVACHGGMGDLIIASSFLDRFVREYCCPPVDVVLSAPQRVKEGEFVFHGSPAVRRITCCATLTRTRPRMTSFSRSVTFSPANMRTRSARTVSCSGVPPQIGLRTANSNAL